MSKKHKDEKKLKQPWRNLHGAVWLLGLGYLFISGDWFPGILWLIGVSMILEAVLMMAVPDAYEEAAPEKTATEPSPTPAVVENEVDIPAPAPKVDSRPYAALPTTCPRCGAPARGHEVIWHNDHAADCAFCGASLPLK